MSNSTIAADIAPQELADQGHPDVSLVVENVDVAPQELANQGHPDVSLVVENGDKKGKFAVNNDILIYELTCIYLSIFP